MANVFASINSKGETGVTSGLRKVKDEEKTKNRPVEERVCVVTAVPAPVARRGLSMPKEGSTARLACTNGSKWIVEHFADNATLVIENTEVNHAVQILDCHRCMVIIKGKITSIAIDSCNKCVVVFDSLVGPCEVANGKAMTVQTLGKCSQFIIDKTEGCQVHLTEEAVGCQIVSSMCTALNVVMPKDDDVVEAPVPEQFCSVFKGAHTLVTSVLAHME